MKTDTKTKTTVELLFAFIDSIPDTEERVKNAAVESALSFVWRAWGWNPDRWQEERSGSGRTVRTQKRNLKYSHGSVVVVCMPTGSGRERQKGFGSQPAVEGGRGFSR